MQGQVENIVTWDHIDWLKKYRNASLTKSGFRSLRSEVFDNTVEVVINGGYYLGSNKICIENQSNFSGKTIFYHTQQSVAEIFPAEHYNTSFSVVHADCIDTANILRLSGNKCAVVNMANLYNPGGGVKGGSGAQEENLFRRTNLFVSLYQFVDYCTQYGIIRNEYHSYPMDEEKGGIYSGNITVFRGSDNTGYCLLKEPYKLDIITVAAIDTPDLIQKGSRFFISDEHVDLTKQKIRTILRIALLNEITSLVLSAFGCGAFHNPPGHMAELFRNVFDEIEFKNKFKIVVFAIIDDRNAWNDDNTYGNYLPFKEIFE